MPKQKTHRGAYKRLRATARGKLKRAHARTSHNFVNKSGKRMSDLHQSVYVSKQEQKRIKKLVPYI